VSRTVTLVLVDAAGAPLGALPPYEVPMPWWQEVSDVVAGARDRYGVDVTVLRLLDSDRPVPHGGAVRYLAEVGAAPAAPLRPTAADLSDHPLRARWAGPGAPAASVSWATAELARLGVPAATAVQQRAWNLSTIWRFDDAASGAPVAWLKQVPPFFGHEAAVLRWLGLTAPGAAPPLLAADPQGRMLLAHVPGEDWYDAAPAGRHDIAADLHRVQRRSQRDLDALVAAGLPDRRSTRLLKALQQFAGVPGVQDLVASLPRRLAEVAACGLPDVLVHGDPHPGNVRVDDGRRVILDWGDCFAGCPAFDILSLAAGLPASDADPLVDEWARRWRAAVPSSDPARAVALLRPIAALRNAAVYADFVANIEPSERPFHAQDVLIWLELAAEAAAS
jgi:hypothetical protein